jgi:hypothetical protein
MEVGGQGKRESDFWCNDWSILFQFQVKDDIEEVRIEATKACG